LGNASVVEQDIGADETHSYQIGLKQDQFAHLLVEQAGVDLVISVLDPNGAALQQFDSRWSGPESVFVLSGAAGDYRIQIRSQLKGQGRYIIRTKELRSRNSGDALRLQAARLATESKRLINQATADSLRAALEKCKAALETWEQVRYPAGEAQGLHTIGYILNEQGQSRQALEYYERSLGLRRQMADVFGEVEPCTTSRRVIPIWATSVARSSSITKF
jgi:tetratricopeptide (TPR) repeat protein